MNVIFETMVGSHMWGVQHEGSDEDRFVCYAAPTKDVLRYAVPIGDVPTGRGFQFHGDKTDTSIHEAGTVVNQLVRGNVNFLWGVMSPIVVKTSPWHEELEEIVKRNVAKNCYNSIHGLAVHNYSKYVESKKDQSEKRCNTIVRTINFGIHLLNWGEFNFIPTIKVKPQDVWDAIKKLDEVYLNSQLPERPNEAEYREWLYRLRVDQLRGVGS